MEKKELYFLVRKVKTSKKEIYYTYDLVVARLVLKYLNENCLYDYEIKPYTLTKSNIAEFYLKNMALKISSLEQFAELQKNPNLCEPKKQQNLKYFVKYHDCWYMWEPSSSNKENAFLQNMSGGGFYVNISQSVIVQALDWSKLDWKDTILSSDKYDTGWLAPNGIFYGCDYQSHSLCAEYILKSSEQDLEMQGYVKISKLDKGAGKNELHAFIGKQKLTSAQYNFLKNSNISNFDEIVWQNRDKNDENVF